MTALESLDRMFQQIQEGWDIPTPQGLLRVKEDHASVLVERMPYSMAKNLAHAVYWQDLWLGALRGDARPPQIEVWKNDFRDPEPSEWKTLRARFIEGLQEARDWCGPRFSEHKRETDQSAIDALLAIAIHGSYHMGQMNLLKRALKKGKEAEEGRRA
ncbi:MAG: DinB family protein [Armatimonadetes bacterium]|nr:DinB family protein [Armatimonadota bacterium]